MGRGRVAAVIALFALAAVLSAVFMGKVAINYNLADYLGKDTQTKIALDLIEDEFGMTGSLQVMVKDVSADTADEICGELEDIPDVLNVSFDKYDENYYKDGNALFVVLIDGDDYSENAKAVVGDVRDLLSSYEVEYGGTTIEKQSLQDSITSEMGYILAISLCLVVAILLITSESWLEPLVLLAASGVAVLIMSPIRKRLPMRALMKSLPSFRAGSGAILRHPHWKRIRCPAFISNTPLRRKKGLHSRSWRVTFWTL